MNDNLILPIPYTLVQAGEIVNVIARTQEPFQPRYIVIPREIAVDFSIINIMVGKEIQTIGASEFPASIFSGKIFMLHDQAVTATPDLPLPLHMNPCGAGWSISLTVRNRSHADRTFGGVIMGPPLEERG